MRRRGGLCEGLFQGLGQHTVAWLCTHGQSHTLVLPDFLQGQETSQKEVMAAVASA